MSAWFVPATARAASATCVRPVNPASRAACTFDVWGYLSWPDGSGAEGAVVSDGAGQSVAAGPGGLYDLYESGPGTYEVTARPPDGGCSVSGQADDNAVAAVIDGGTRVDLQLPCRPLGDVYVQSVDVPDQSFVGCADEALSQACRSYSWKAGTESYTDGSPLTPAAFASALSGPSPATPDSPYGQSVAPDELYAEEVTGGMTYRFDSSGGAQLGDVPAAPGAPTAGYVSCPSGGTKSCSPGMNVTWSPPPNPDVGGPEATGSGAWSTASYAVWRMTVSGSTYSDLTDIGRVNVVPPGWSGPMAWNIPGGVTSVDAPRMLDDTAEPGVSYAYLVIAWAAPGTYGGGQSGPESPLGNVAEMPPPPPPPTDVFVQSVDAGAASFVGCSDEAVSTNCQTYNYGSGSDLYVDGSVMSPTAFGEVLSGPDEAPLPNSTSDQSVRPDEVLVGQSGGKASYQLDIGGSPGLGDVPAPPTNASAAYNGCAYLSGSMCQPGDVVTWSPPPNPDVSGTEATTTQSSTQSSGNASYTVWREELTDGTYSVPVDVGTVTVVPGSWSGTPPDQGPGVTPNGGVTPVGSPQLIDGSIAPGTEYVYFVTATAAAGMFGGGQTGPASDATPVVITGSTPPGGG